MSRNLSVHERRFGSAIENQIAETLLSDRERILLPLLFAAPEKNKTREYCKTIEMLTDYLNIDQEQLSFLLMLAVSLVPE